MEAYKLKAVIKKDGEIKVTGIPFNKGEKVEMIILLDSSNKSKKKDVGVNNLLESDIIGIWEDREDIYDSSEYARNLRDLSQYREFDP